MKYQLISQLQKYFSSLIYLVSLFLIFNVFFCFIAPCYSDTIENQDNTGNKSFDDLHSIDFVKCQCGSQFVHDLYSQITNDIKNLPCLKTGNDITDQLNKLLEVPNFYDILHKILKERNPKIKHSKKIDKLVRKTEKYLNKSNLKEEQFNIKKLNRLLLEETYPKFFLDITENKNNHIKNHILVIQKDGRLCEPESHGKEKLIEGEEYSKIFYCSAENEYIKGIIKSINNWSSKNRSPKKQILIFIHGGLNEFKDSYERANKLLFCEHNIPENIYPIIINWESGLVSAYFDHVISIRQGDTYYKGQKVAWAFAAPFIALSDLGKGIVRMPYTTGYQIQNYCKTIPTRHELATEEINKVLDNKNKDQPKPIKISNVKYEQLHPFDRKRFLEDSLAIPLSPFKLITNAVIDGGGKGAWETWVRRTQTMFNSPEESKEDAQLIVTPNDRKIANNEAKIRVIPKPTGAISRFMDTLQREFKNPKEYEINLIGHSMGTIVANEILHRYRYFTFKNIVYMGAACSINDFRVNVIPYLRRHRKTEFYNLCLHPYAELRESLFGGLIPRGSLLEWLDDYLTSPNTTLDRRMGKWENIVRATNIIPNDVRDRVSLKAFELEYDYSYFNLGEFRQSLTVEKLCKVINDDNYNVSPIPTSNTIAWLNEILKVSNFYDILHERKPGNSYSENVEELVHETKNYRNESFSNLSRKRQFNIKKLNRLLLEETYPQETPKNQKYMQRCEKCHKHLLQKPPANPGNPQKHGEFTNQRFWEENFWNP